MTVLTKNIESLPTEVLSCIFSHADKESIPQARLVSRTFNNAAFPFLITYATVSITSKSLLSLEKLCDHAIFSKSICHVTIIISQYDVGMAADRSLFLEDCHSSLYRHLEILERMGSRRTRAWRNWNPVGDGDEGADVRAEVEKTLWGVINNREFLKISEGDFDEQSATSFQQLAMRLYTMYKEKCEDQEEVRSENVHIGRLCAALRKLTNLAHLRFHDVPYTFQKKLQESDFQDLGFRRHTLRHFDSRLSPSRWCGSMTTGYTIAPPFEMLGELCARLGQSGIRPQTMTMKMNAPANLRPMALSLDQQQGLRLLVSRAIGLFLVVDGWARKDSLAENNDRPRDEMLALCSFTQPFFSAPYLKSLYIYFAEYPRFNETPNVSLSDILPLENSWSELHTVDLNYQPATLEDLKKLVALQENTVQDFNWECGWLLNGTWEEVLDVLRGLRRIEKMSMRFPRGERFGEGGGTGRSTNPDVPYDEFYSYILKETDVNPMVSGSYSLASLA